MGVNLSKMLFMGAGGAATLWIYSMLKGHRPLRTPSTPIMGLRNCGNTCFLNAILQAFASCRFMTGWLRQKDEDCNCALARPVSTLETYSGVSYPLIAAMFRAILVLNRNLDVDENIYAGKVPSDVLSGLRSHGHRISVQHEQDAYEVFLLIAMALNHEVELSVLRKQTGSMSVLTDGLVQKSEMPLPWEDTAAEVMSQGDINVQGGEWTMIGDPGTFRVNNQIYSKRKIEMKWDYKRSPKNPFRCLMFSQMQCIVCMSKTSVRLEAADSLTLTLPAPEASSRLSIQDLFVRYMRPTLVHNVDCDTCTAKNLGDCTPVASGRPKTQSTFFKYNYIAKLPNSLCIHIPRCFWGPFGMVKRCEYVAFPERINLALLKRLYDPDSDDENELSPHEICNPKSDNESGLRRFKNSEYGLVAVVSHFGSVDSGHFVTFRRFVSKNNPNLSTWYYISDEVVEAVPFITVLATRAYMLFYEKTYANE